MRWAMAGRLQRPTRRRTWWAAGAASREPSSSRVVSTGQLFCNGRMPAPELAQEADSEARHGLSKHCMADALTVTTTLRKSAAMPAWNVTCVWRAADALSWCAAAGHASAGIGRKDLGGVDAHAQQQQQQQQHLGVAHPGESPLYAVAVLALAALACDSLAHCFPGGC